METRTDKEIILDLIEAFLQNPYVDQVSSSMTLTLLKHRLTEPLPTLR